MALFRFFQPHHQYPPLFWSKLWIFYRLSRRIGLQKFCNKKRDRKEDTKKSERVKYLEVEWFFVGPLKQMKLYNSNELQKEIRGTIGSSTIHETKQKWVSSSSSFRVLFFFLFWWNSTWHALTSFKRSARGFAALPIMGLADNDTTTLAWMQTQLNWS